MTDDAGLVPRTQLVEMLRKCREQFVFYGKNHRAKVPQLRTRLSQTKDTSPTADKLRGEIEATQSKAAVNEQMAKQIDDLIGAPPGEKA